MTKPAATKSFPVDFDTFTEEIFNGKLHFLCSVIEVFLVCNLLKKDSFADVFLQTFGVF